MKIIRAHEQTIESRGDEGRGVRYFFNERVGAYDSLTVTNSHGVKVDDGSIAVGEHRHPNAIELIIFNRAGKLEINGKMHCFDVNDAVLLESSDVHGISGLHEHDCICILLGKGKPQKR